MVWEGGRRRRLGAEGGRGFAQPLEGSLRGSPGAKHLWGRQRGGSLGNAQVILLTPSVPSSIPPWAFKKSA